MRSSTSARSSSHVAGGAAGTATTIRAGSSVRSAAIAARIVEPVARPSSTTIATRPRTSGGGRSPRKARSRRSSSARSRSVTCSRTLSGSLSAFTTSSLRTRAPPLAIAPIASSSWPGRPSLRTRNTSSGAPRARATSAATGTPPRGRPRTITSSRPAYSDSLEASARPAARRFAKRAGGSAPTLTSALIMSLPRRLALSPRDEAVRMDRASRLEAAPAQARCLAHVDHRPYPLSTGRWFMGQSWLELLFAHWPVPVEALRPHVPDALEVESHDGSAWLGIAPFRIAALRVRGAPSPPFVASFRELNVRTYVTRNGRPGIWFLSLDASSRVAVRAARRLYHLPYFHALIEWRRGGGGIHFRSTRQEDRPARFDAEYRPVGDVFHPEPGTLE